jgi:hypothetical protein
MTWRLKPGLMAPIRVEFSGVFLIPQAYPRLVLRLPSARIISKLQMRQQKAPSPRAVMSKSMSAVTRTSNCAY